MARRLASLLVAAPLAMSLLVPAGAAASVALTPGTAVLATSHCLIASPKNVHGPGTTLVSGVCREREEVAWCSRVADLRCCAEDGELLAPWRRPAGGGVKPPHAALAEDRRGER